MGTFGTTVNPAHFVEAPDPGNAAGQPARMVRPPAGTTLKVQSPNGGGMLTPITTAAYGYWAASYAGVDAILVSADGGVTWVGPLFSAELMAAAQTAADSASQARDTVVAVTSNLPANIASAIAGSPSLLATIKGAPGDPGTPGLSNYAVWLAAGNTGTVDDYNATLIGAAGTAGPAATQFYPTWDLGVVANVASPDLEVSSASPSGEKILLIQFNLDSPTTTAAKFNIAVDTGPGPVNLFPDGSEVTIAAGQKQVRVKPSNLTLPAGATFSAKIIVAPSTAGGSSTPNSSYVASTSYGAGLTTTADTHPLVLPSGGATGDRVVVAVPETSAQTRVKMSDSRFVEVIRAASSGTTPQLSGIVFEAPWSSDLSCAVRTFNSADGTTAVLRVMAAVAVIVRGSSVNFTQAALSSPGDAQGPSLVSPAVVASQPAGSGLYFDFIKVPAGATSTSLTPPADGPSGAATVQTTVTSHATAQNIGVVVRTFGAISNGATIPSTTFSWTSPQVITAMTQVAGPVTFPAGQAASGVTRATGFISTQRI